ncbi:DUF551 domain-containing protein [Citrobacter sp. MAL-2]
MTTITKEQTQKIIDAADEVITALAGTNDDVHPDNSAKMCGLWDELNDRYAPPEVVRELARIALASIEAEAVTNEIVIPEPATHRNINEICPPGVNQTLFASGWNASRKSGMNSGRIPPIVKGIDAECVGWNACRAAMLQGAEPASNCDELPLDYLQGHKDGLEWAAQLAKANHPETGDWLYDDPIELSKAIRKGPDMPLSDGNSPVIQDGWIKCSERMPEDEQEVLTRNRMGHCFVSFFDEHSGLFFDRVDVAAACCIEHILVTHWMPLPAAPQQEE